MDSNSLCFGAAIKSKYFSLAEGYTNFNHGSFGAVARPVAAAQKELFLEQESRPDRWFRQSYFVHLNAARRILANIVHANEEDIILLENASSAVNSILRSLSWSKGDKVLRLSTCYGMVINTLAWLVEVYGIEVVNVEVTFPVRDSQQIIQAVQEAYLAHSNIKMSIFSHISSMPSMIEPIEQLAAMGHQAGSLVLIDGAHAPG